jgi:hypothetical protein
MSCEAALQRQSILKIYVGHHEDTQMSFFFVFYRNKNKLFRDSGVKPFKTKQARVFYSLKHPPRVYYSRRKRPSCQASATLRGQAFYKLLEKLPAAPTKPHRGRDACPGLYQIITPAYTYKLANHTSTPAFAAHSSEIAPLRIPASESFCGSRTCASTRALHPAFFSRSYSTCS